MSIKSLGEVKSINISKNKGEVKLPVESVNILPEGIENDAHRGNWHRQVSILSYEDIEEVKKKIPSIKPGDFAENITITGIDLSKLNIGSRIKIISKDFFNCLDNSQLKALNINNVEGAELEITQIGKECITPCSIFHKLGYCIMPRSGIFCKVIKDGKISIGDKIRIIKK